MRGGRTCREKNLTPLLDVIFIFLFVVIIAYAAKAQAVEAEAVSRTEELEKQVEELNARLTEEESLREMYEKRLSDYESDVIGGRVKIVTIYCTWDDEDSTKRQIRVDRSGSSRQTRSFLLSI